ncbi:unnamed protein product [Pieris macdunnoughi]|uniref:Uncharacterized protein n=1 Tax=Pieris macdunnoughi TaxID=345717 RepID=A0A821WMA1_9NEOP|nr:unnamed protein product [Pieris macdunnoughi]
MTSDLRDVSFARSFRSASLDYDRFVYNLCSYGTSVDDSWLAICGRRPPGARGVGGRGKERVKRRAPDGPFSRSTPGAPKPTPAHHAHP